MVGRHIQDVVDGAGVQYAPLVRDNICGSRTMDAKDATQTQILNSQEQDLVTGWFSKLAAIST